MTNNWRHHARCLGADPELFYPATDEAAEETARDLHDLPRCGSRASSTRSLPASKQGVWGGLTERERRRMIRQRRKSA